ncbi:MAG: VWA domain-containing protein [Candidatus Hodarchaeales archaeon]|jgi:hypothetical protein
MKNKLISIVIIVLILFILPLRNIAIVQGVSYQKTYTTTDNKFKIYYNDTDGGARQNVTLAQVQDFGNNVLKPVRTKELSYGFPDTSGYPKRVNIFEQRKNAHGGSGGMDFDPWWLGNTFHGTLSATEPRLIAIHEFQHVLQMNQGLSHLGGKWVWEAQARMLQDKLYNDIDQSDGTDFASYLGQVTGYLGNPDHPLMDISYDAALFWTYVSEKYGTIATEPDLGLDAIVQWWKAARSYGTASDEIKVFNKMLDNLNHGSTTFKDVFKDFIVSLYAKDLTGARVPSKYKYADETQTPGAYRKVALNVNNTMSYGSTVAGTDFVDSWAPKYYVVWPKSREPNTLINVEVKQITSNKLFYDLLIIKNNGIVSETRVTGTHFSRAVVTDADALVLVVGGLANSKTDPAKFHYSFSSGTGFYLDIQAPQNTNGLRARVGNSTDPEKLLSIVEVLSSGNPVHGLTRSDFHAKIGTENATILSATSLGSLYFLAIQAPKQSSDGLYDLKVVLAGLSDTEINSVDYSNTYIDSMMVIDRSGSMGWNEKIDATQSAGRLYVNSFLKNDYLGLATFNESASLIYGLREVDTIRSTIITAINAISTGGATSVGDGIFTAQNEFFSNGHPTYNKHIVLLTDGVENTAPFIKNVENFLWNGANNTRLHVVLIGLDAEARKLQFIALKSGGGVYFAFDPSSGTLTSDLADIYRSIIEDATNEQRIFSNLGSRTGSWTLSESFSMDLAKSGTVIISYNSTVPLSSGDFALANTSVILNPSYFNQKVSSNDNYYGHAVFHLKSITAGSYEIRTNSAKSGSIEYFVEAAVASPISADMYFGLPESQRVVANEMPVLVSVSNNKGPIKGASVIAKVISGSSYKNYKSWRLQLYDDGGHGDGFANDGVYGNNFTRTYFDWRTENNRTYVVKATIEGNSYTGDTFTREANGAFTLTSDRVDQEFFIQDSDNDGMPDHWEIRHGLSSTSDIGDDGSSGDPDNDGLVNIEELEEGTYPNDPDTDNGGEKDSEAKFGRDPYWFDDDFYRPVIHASSGNKLVTLVISGSPSYSSFNLYRSEISSSTNFNLVESGIPASGSSDIKYTDTGLINGVQVWYAVVAIGTSGEETTYSNIVSATPRSDPTLPWGFVVINSGNSVTTSATVHLRLLAASDVVEMKLSNHSDFNGASWQPYISETSAVLDGTGLQFVYVQYKDSAGNIGASDDESSLYFYDGIILDPTATLPTTTITTPTSSTTPESSSWNLIFSLGALLSVIVVFRRHRKSGKN